MDASDLEVAFALPSVEPPRARRTWRQRWKVPLIALAFIATMVATSLITKAVIPSRVTISGQLELTADNLDKAGAACAGQGSFSDVRRGAQVVITDEAGTTMRLAELGPGRSSGSKVCSFPFSVPDVGPRDFYGVEVANRKVQFSYEQVAAGPITLTLGD